MRTIAIIPARGGSKRVPRKNIKDFLGKPIIAYSVEAAIESRVFDEVMVSTDDPEIAGIAKQFGASVPFFRSQELATDTAMTVPVLIDVIREYERRGQLFDQLCCFYPCAPFVCSYRLKEAMSKLEDTGCDCVFPIVKFSYPPQRCLVIRDGKTAMLHPEYYNARSQDLAHYYHDAGQFYCIKKEALFREKRLMCANTQSVILSELEVQDIDTDEDWKIAEMKYRLLHPCAETMF